MLEFWDGTRKSAKFYLLTQTCIKPTNKLVSSLFEAPLVLGQATGNFGLTKLTMARTRGKPPPSPIWYSLCLLVTPTSEWLFVRDSRGGVPKLSRFGLSGLWELITPCLDLRLGWGLKQTCSSPQELSNGMSNSTYTHQGRVNSWFLVVGS